MNRYTTEISLLYILPDVSLMRMTYMQLHGHERKNNDVGKKLLCAFKRQYHIVILGLFTSRLWRWTDSSSEGDAWGGEKVWEGRV